jgi:abequosyltransferase
MKKITFCIPTYNRATFIGECLDSIIAQATPDVEIVIVDGASTDNTKEIIHDYQKKFPFIRYFRREKNLGVDQDILKMVELAQGQHCWLMSDDDKLEPGALHCVLSALNKYSDLAVLSLNYVSYDSQMQYKIYTSPASIGGKLRTDYRSQSREEFFSLLGIHIGFISAQIIRKELWDKVVENNNLAAYLNSYWLHVYIIGRILELNSKWLYIHQQCIGNRSANDSFASRVGAYNRQLITHAYFTGLIKDLFGRTSPAYHTVLSGIISDRMPKNLATLKAAGIPLSLQFNLLILYTRLYSRFPDYWLKVFPVFFIPNNILKITRTLYLNYRERLKLST